MVCNTCKKIKYCNHICRARKDEKEKIILDAISKTEFGKKLALISKYTSMYTGKYL